MENEHYYIFFPLLNESLAKRTSGFQVSCWEISTTESLGWKNMRQQQTLPIQWPPTWTVPSSNFSNSSLVTPLHSQFPFVDAQWEEILMKGQSCHCPIWPTSQRELATHARKSFSWEEPPVGSALSGPWITGWLVYQFLWLPRIQRDFSWMPHQVAHLSSFVVAGGGMGEWGGVKSYVSITNCSIVDWLGSPWIWIFSSVWWGMNKNQMINVSELSARWHEWVDFLTIIRCTLGSAKEN